MSSQNWTASEAMFLDWNVSIHLDPIYNSARLMFQQINENIKDNFFFFFSKRKKIEKVHSVYLFFSNLPSIFKVTTSRTSLSPRTNGCGMLSLSDTTPGEP